MRGRGVCRESRGRAQRRRPPPLQTRPGCGKRGCGPESLRAHLAVPAAWRPRRPGFQKVLCGHRGDAWGRVGTEGAGSLRGGVRKGGGGRRAPWAPVLGPQRGAAGLPGSSRGGDTVDEAAPPTRAPPQAPVRRSPRQASPLRQVLPQRGATSGRCPPPPAGRCSPRQVSSSGWCSRPGWGGGAVGSSFPSGSRARRLGGADGSPRERWVEAGTARCRGDPGAGARVRAQVWGPPGPPPPALQGHPIPRVGWGAGVGGSGTFWRTLWPLRTSGCRPPRERGGHRVPPRICPSPVGAGNICMDSVPALFPSCS